MSSIIPPATESGLLTAAGLRASLAERFDLTTHHLQIHDASFALTGVRNPDVLLDAVTPEEFAVDERLPYWAQLWSSSIALAGRLMVDERVRGARILEIGCGLGLAGIAAARAGALVDLTDYDADAVAFAQLNALANAPEAYRDQRITAFLLDWRNPRADLRADMVVAADVVYERKTYEPLLAFFESTLAPGGCILMSEPGRSVGDGFFSEATSAGFVVHRSCANVEHAGRCTEVQITELRKGEHP